MPVIDKELDQKLRKLIAKQPDGHYIFRTKPRHWGFKQGDKITIGPEAAPKQDGGCIVTFVDTDEITKPGRKRYNPQNMYVHEGKVYNASAHIFFRDKEGKVYTLFIKDKLNWNAPIVRVDGDEFEKKENKSIIDVLQFNELDATPSQFCTLGALRVAMEEADIDLRDAVSKGGISTIHFFTSDSDIRLTEERNNDTTVSTQVVIDLGEQNPQIFKKLNLQASENVTEAKVKVFPLDALKFNKSAKNKNDRYFLDIEGEHLPVFHKLGEILSKLRDEHHQLITGSEQNAKIKFTSIAPEIVRKNAVSKKPAEWYVPAVDDKDDVVKGKPVTVFDPKNYYKESSSAEVIEKQFYLISDTIKRNRSFNLSPERLALHELTVQLAVFYKWKDEKAFQKAVGDIYKEEVKRAVDENVIKLDGIYNKVVEEVDQAIRILSSHNISGFNNEASIIVSDASKRFDENLENYNKELDALNKKINNSDNLIEGAQRYSRKDKKRQRELQKLIDYMLESKEALIREYAVETLLLKRNTDFIKEILTGEKGGVLNDKSLQDKYGLKPMKLHSKESRRGILVVGGPASGKGSVTSILKLQVEKDGILEVNPDTYKPILLPLEEMVTDNDKKMHAALVHSESSIVYEKIIEKWKEMAKQGSAPHILSDVLRASDWARGVIGTGGTPIEIHTPVLSTKEALRRAYERGKRTGRFVPTSIIIWGHKDQVKLNLDSMKAGCKCTFYNNHIKHGEKPPLAAHFSAKKVGALEITDLATMYNYFEKEHLNIHTKNELTLYSKSPKKMVQTLLDHASVMDVIVYSEGKVIFTMSENSLSFSGVYNNEIKEEILRDLIEGCIENKINIDTFGNDKLNELIKEIGDRLNSRDEDSEKIVIEEYDIEVDDYINMLCNFVERERRYVSTERDLFVYKFPRNQKEFEESFPMGVNVIPIDEESGKLKSLHSYNLNDKDEKVLTFDVREFGGIEECKKALDDLKKTGQLKKRGIALRLFDEVLHKKIKRHELNNVAGELNTYKTLDKNIVVAMQSEKDDLQIFNRNGKIINVANGDWIKCRLENFEKLSNAVKLYKKDPNPRLRNDLIEVAKKAVFRSGATNIDSGYNYYVDNNKILSTIKDLYNSVNAKTLLKRINNSGDGTEFISVRMDKFVAFDKDWAVEPGQWLIIEKDTLPKLINILDKKFATEQNANLAEVLKGKIQVLDEAVKELNYTEIKNEIETGEGFKKGGFSQRPYFGSRTLTL